MGITLMFTLNVYVYAYDLRLCLLLCFLRQLEGEEVSALLKRKWIDCARRMLNQVFFFAYVDFGMRKLNRMLILQVLKSVYG